MLRLDPEEAKAYFARMTRPTFKKVVASFMGVSYTNFDKIKKADLINSIPSNWAEFKQKMQAGL